MFETLPKSVRLLSVLATLLIAGCTAPVRAPTGERTEVISAPGNRGIDRLLLEASRTIPPDSTQLNLQAARLAIDLNDIELTRRIIDSIESPYANSTTTREYSFLVAELALHDQDPRLAINILDDRRLQKIRLDTPLQIRAGRLRSGAYFQGRSYLASARELIYINDLLPRYERQENSSQENSRQDSRQENQEKIFSILLRLSSDTLEKQASASITSDIRGWLSLAAMTKKFQHDPLRQLTALNDWQRLWPHHPAALLIPKSLQLLSSIVEEQPRNIALLLPLSGTLGKYGRAIRDGFIAAHFENMSATKLAIFDTTNRDILEVMARASAQGAELIIGPLDRARVTTLARVPLEIPVIALNRTLAGEVNPNLYQFGLAPEDESIQVAEQVVREGRQSGLVIAPDNEWGERNRRAFAERFNALGGVIVDTASFTDQRDYSEIIKSLLNVDSSEARAATLRRITGERFQFSARRRQDIDFVFLLSNPTQARGINPTLAFFYAEDIPVYATSHVHEATDSRLDIFDMNGIRFCDIPWKLTNTDPLQSAIQETWSAAATQLAPFYALGLDVHRLYPRLEQLKQFDNERIFGATGILTLNEDNVVHRTLMWARFRNGEIESIPMIFDTSQSVRRSVRQ